MIIFSKYGDYDRRKFIQQCFERYVAIMSETKCKNMVNVKRDANNKPYFKDYPNIKFSISHSDNLVVLAMAETDVGIDIEKIKPRNYEAIVKKCFTKGEAEKVKDLNSFIKVWTQKEAFLKLTGDGLKGLTDADVSKCIKINNQPLVFTSLDIYKDYIGTVVAVKQPIIIEQLN